ncbi:MAG: hypothetical protein IJF14_01875 [Clostridia bacterium]|nr:hypothetical protein [Clostridia bacterium]
MVKELIHDPIYLAGKSGLATKEDLQVAQDLLDTLIAHKDSCAGMETLTIVTKRMSCLKMNSTELLSRGGVLNLKNEFEIGKYLLNRG